MTKSCTIFFIVVLLLSGCERSHDNTNFKPIGNRIQRTIDSEMGIVCYRVQEMAQALWCVELSPVPGHSDD